MQQSILKFYCFVVQTLLNMFRALLCPSSGARQTAFVVSGFRMNVEVDVFSAHFTSDRPRHHLSSGDQVIIRLGHLFSSMHSMCPFYFKMFMSLSSI
jgi:hypothetical protein